MCVIHPRNCPGGMRKRNSDTISNFRDTDTASITEVYLQNKQLSLGSLYNLINDYLDVKEQRPTNTYEDILYDQDYNFDGN
ncbi:Hypothetical predicted protein [Mytilus galloprovincialis]|uniref:Uncharacterized protein n=1 Tax=Mytilus galloprovincialis TaxID=29158 RepID=A0A8B6DWY9_MYTGA|nr:Hypothetical predicted protein [Mytilus galloprovincialis]